ncbi:hypothetical protein BDB01DRAFT_729447 [Pilobolus umbonatus]|nr:hypothetical protein BDB01DRAFT_729447 [Pilobolus umbonatus]
MIEIKRYQKLSSISLTHVQFNPYDKLAYLLAYITLTPIALLIFYGSVIVSRREMASIIMLCGQLLNEGLNSILKGAFEQKRPHAHLGDGYGMPSSHSQFICVYLGYHTANQVLVGSLVGMSFAILWYFVTIALHENGVVDYILELPLSQKLYLKDMSGIDNLALWEYEQWSKLRAMKSSI